MSVSTGVDKDASVPIQKSKLHIRITKGRIACAVVLLPVVYALNAGPMNYVYIHVPASRTVLMPLYKPLFTLIKKSPFEDKFAGYVSWWASLPPPPPWINPN